MELTLDMLLYIGKVGEWLKTAPEETFSYGAFYVTDVEVRYDGEPIGKFRNEDPEWVFVTNDEYFGASKS